MQGNDTTTTTITNAPPVGERSGPWRFALRALDGSGRVLALVEDDRQPEWLFYALAEAGWPAALEGLDSLRGRSPSPALPATLTTWRDRQGAAWEVFGQAIDPATDAAAIVARDRARGLVRLWTAGEWALAFGGGR